ncbi:von Willebrand factor-like isoform X1 [Vespa velutina]|uniref:von Willebrand factor-like isoform X1 n=1 Tax=Vespa velutina TaxID=202808 RepID=UPI001FB2573D|nr:von Willebrand factor-like isoform X1 [Vespa velutina]
MSCCEGVDNIERSPGTGCCGTKCTVGSSGCSTLESRIRSCHCQNNVGCLDRNDCGGFRPSGTAATGACPGPCQCLEEEIWNSNVPPKPNCEWLSNFSELRRQWSNHARQQNCKCCNCRSCRTVAPCRPCLPTTLCTSDFVVPSSDCQDYCEDHRLAGGANDKRDLSPVESTSSRESRNVRREAGGGCPPPGCGRSCQTARCRSPSTDRSSSCSWCPTSVQRPSSPCKPSNLCQPCAPSPKSILKKRSCCQCATGYCMCQPMPRNCNCPPPIQIDARAERDCTCDCPSSPECACPPSERRFPRTIVKCPNARLCCPLPRLPPGSKCHCDRCQPCLPAPCDPCTSSICQNVIPKANPCCPSSPCPPRSPCRPKSPDLQPCRLPSPCRKSTQRYCLGRNSCRDDTYNACPRVANDRRSSGTCGGTGQSSTIRRRRAGGDKREEIIATKFKDESISTNDHEGEPRNPFLSGYCEKADDRECEREGGGCSYELDLLDCRRHIDRSDEIRSDNAFNHTSSLNTVSCSAYQRRDESVQVRFDIDCDYSRELASIDDSSCHRRHHRDPNSTCNSSCTKSFQDCLQCCCGRDEIGCDLYCDYCCSFKDEPRCRCAPDGNGCDKTCNYCCAFNDSDIIIVDNISTMKDERKDVSNVISNGDD